MKDDRISEFLQPDDYLLKLFGAAHSGRWMCLSVPTEGTNLLILEYGFKPLSMADDLSYIIANNIHDCIGSQSEIREYVEKLRSGNVHNTDPNSVYYVAPLTEPVKIRDTDTYFARIQTTYVFKGTKDGLGPLTFKIGASTFTGLVIADGKEYVFLNNQAPLQQYQVFHHIRGQIEESGVYASFDKPINRVRANMEEAWQAKVLNLLVGAVSVYPPILGNSDLLSPTYLRTLAATIRTRILRDRNEKSGSVVDYLLEWSPQREKLFMAMFEFGLFRKRIWDSRTTGLKQFYAKVSKTSNIQGTGSYNNIVYHAEKIQKTLDQIHESLVQDNSGFEYHLVYEILKRKREIEIDP